jgi:hypothetical protein
MLQAAKLGNRGQTHVPWSQNPKQTRGTPTHTHPTPPAHKQRRGVASYWSLVQDLNSVAKFIQLYSNWVILFGDFGCELSQPLQVTTYEGDSIHWDLKISKDLYFCEPQKCGLVKSIRFGSKFLTIESYHSDWLLGCKLQTIAFNLLTPCKTSFINTHIIGKWTKE